MAERGDPSDTRRQEDTIREKERKITELEGEVERLQKELQKHHHDEYQTEINRLNKEIQRQEAKIKQFQLSEDELVVGELCSKVQQNILKIVLQEYFDKFVNKSIKYVPDYINGQIEDEEEQEKAKRRWEELSKELEWENGFWIKMLKPVKDRGNDAAHPDLTVEKIDAAKENLEEEQKLSKNMVKAVDHLKDALEQTNRKLLPGISSAKGQDPSYRN